MVEMLYDKATGVADMLKLMANEQRLMLLCRLQAGEASVSELVRLTGQSQSAISQHLARLRDSGIVATRREAQMIYYRLVNADVAALMGFLCARFAEHEADSGPADRSQDS